MGPAESTRKGMPGRLLTLLSLLQTRREWSGSELADRLGVTGRTVRRDIERLRALDYPVQGTTGTAGGYRLGSGANLPPLQLDDEEAIAVAIGLATGAGGSVAGIQDSSLRALAKLQRVLPARLRPSLSALGNATAAIPHRDVQRADPASLAVLAGCCRDQELLSFDYRNRHDELTARRVEPHQLVALQGRWYLVGYDLLRADWRTFRVDRIGGPRSTLRRFTPRELPAADAAGYLARSFAEASYRYRAQIGVKLSAAAVRAAVFAAIPGDIDSTGPNECTVRLTADSAELVVQFVTAIAALGAPVTIDAEGDIADRLTALGRLLK
ncbi:MAG: helix-turn-helix transcriptional regulator [Nakamurella sp.]